MRKSRQKKLGAAVAAACCAGVMGVALADDIPFLKPGTSSLPTRAPMAQASSTAAAPMDSRAVQTVASAPVTFDSSGQPGLSILVR